ncbi:MAG TPA: FlgD immunoglobulin-like domain containing protein [Candidatus Kapabacteria bacterium]|nr:FlgD immunoglobulin-like domain containing protein [Candidatus Kapabacteria bacterium]
MRPAQDGSLSPWCPTAGFNAWVYVRVTNIGPDQLNDGEVHVYYGEASTSLGNWPGNWVNNAPHGDEIGFAPVNGLVGNGGTTIVAIPWPNVPANSGTDHFCLVARFVSPVGSGNVTVGFTLPAAGPVTLAVYDLNGRLVRTLLSGSNMSGGAGEVVWDGRSDAGQPVTSGTYFTRLSAERTSVERQIKIVR